MHFLKVCVDKFLWGVTLYFTARDHTLYTLENKFIAGTTKKLRPVSFSFVYTLFFSNRGRCGSTCFH